MDHVVYVDAKAKEMDNLIEGNKKMIIRGAAGRKMPYGRVNAADVFYFINNDAEGIVKATGRVSSVYNSKKMSEEESTQLIEKNQDELQLNNQQFKRWAGKRYLVLLELKKC